MVRTLQVQVAERHVSDEETGNSRGEHPEHVAVSAFRLAEQQRGSAEDQDEVADGVGGCQQGAEPVGMLGQGGRAEHKIPDDHPGAQQYRASVEPELGLRGFRPRRKREGHQPEHQRRIEQQIPDVGKRREWIDPQHQFVVGPQEIAAGVEEHGQRGSAPGHTGAAFQRFIGSQPPRQDRRGQPDRREGQVADGFTMRETRRAKRHPENK